MNLSIITKNHAADPEIGFLAKPISKFNGYATAMPTAWELTYSDFLIFFCENKIFCYRVNQIQLYFVTFVIFTTFTCEIG